MVMRVAHERIQYSPLKLYPADRGGITLSVTVQTTRPDSKSRSCLCTSSAPGFHTRTLNMHVCAHVLTYWAMRRENAGVWICRQPPSSAAVVSLVVILPYPAKKREGPSRPQWFKAECSGSAVNAPVSTTCGALGKVQHSNISSREILRLTSNNVAYPDPLWGLSSCMPGAWKDLCFLWRCLIFITGRTRKKQEYKRGPKLQLGPGHEPISADTLTHVRYSTFFLGFSFINKKLV